MTHDDLDVTPYLQPIVAPTKRTRLAREQRVQRILDVSQRLFATRTYDAIAIEDVAEAAGMSQGLLYHYFAGKRELYVATVRHVLAQMLQFTDFHPDLHTSLSKTLSLFEQYPGLAKMVLRGGIGSNTEVDALLAEHRQQQLERVCHGLGLAGGCSSAPPLVLLGLRGWLSLLDEVCLQWVRQPDVSRDQVVLFLKRSLHATITATVPRQEWSQLGLDGEVERKTERTETEESA
jgi:AcrR family transcriptional regulator